MPQAISDVLWRTGRFIQNGPCAYYKEDVTYQEFWHEGTDTQADSPACIDARTSWSIPVQNEWGSLYKGGTISGTASAATANTWVWYNGTTTNYSRGYEIKPDGVTTTMFLPTSGFRSNGNGSFNTQGTFGYYWSASIIGANSYHLLISSSEVSPALSNYRSYGFAVLRCIKTE